jgi:hypothetical protein
MSDKLQFVAKLRQAKACRTSNCITRFPFLLMKQLRCSSMANQSELLHAAPVPLVEVWRGPIVESVHRGHLAAVDGSGKTVAELGSPETVTYFRSSSKLSRRCRS